MSIYVCMIAIVIVMVTINCFYWLFINNLIHIKNLNFFPFLIQQITMMSWTHFKMFLFISFLVVYIVWPLPSLNSVALSLAADGWWKVSVCCDSPVLDLSHCWSVTNGSLVSRHLLIGSWYSSGRVPQETQYAVLSMGNTRPWSVVRVVRRFREWPYHPGLDHLLFPASQTTSLLKVLPLCWSSRLLSACSWWLTDCNPLTLNGAQQMAIGWLACLLRLFVHILNQISPPRLTGGLLNDTGCELVSRNCATVLLTSK